MTASRKIQSILSQCFFFVDPRAKLSRKELQEWLVELALYQATKPLDADDIATSIFTKVLPVDENPFKARWTKDACDRLREKGRINSITDREEMHLFILSDQRRTQLDITKRRLDDTIKQFEELVKRAYRAEVKDNIFPMEQERAIIEATHLMVQDIFVQNAIRLAFLIDSSSGKRYFKDNYEEITGNKFLLERLDSIFGGKDLRVPRISHAIIETLLSGDPTVQQYLTICHHKVLYSHLLDIDPSLQKYQSELLKQRTIILDGNVIIAMMFRKHPRHTVVQNLFEDAQRLDMKLGVFTWTIQEVKHYIDGVKKDLLNFEETIRDQRKSKRIAHILEELLEIKGPPSAIDMPFLDSYFAGFEPRYWLEERNIMIYEGNPPYEEDRLSEVKSILYEHKLRRYGSKETPHPNVIEHDALCLLEISELRQETDGDTMGPRIWFLTLDMALASAEREMVLHRKLYPLPCSLRVNDFIEELMAYEAPQMPIEKYHSYIGLLVESWIAAIDFDEEINSEELLSIVNNPALPASQMLESSEEKAEYQARTFVESRFFQSLINPCAQQDKYGQFQELNMMLDQVRRAREKEVKQRISIELDTILQEKIDRLEQVFSEELSRERQERQEIMANMEELGRQNSKLQVQLTESNNQNRRLRLSLFIILALFILIGGPMLWFFMRPILR
ncbi:MAG: hypothetical protein HPY52_10475 [Firmicutes bacterium]|nr:hypothetical protein [Bacillota bacterium]